MWACWAGVVKGTGMPCLRSMFLNGRNLWMGQWASDGVRGSVCLYVCLYVRVWHSEEVLNFPHSLSSFSSVLRAENIAAVLQAFSEYPLKAYWSWCLLCQTVLGCVCAWHCTMSGRSLVGSEPGLLQARWKIEEEAWFQWYSVFALSLIRVHSLYRG